MTIGYAGTASPDWQVALTSDLLTEIQFRERVESVLSKLGLPYCIFEGTEISPDSQLGEMAQALGAETAVPKHLQTEQIDKFCSKHVPSLVRDGCLDRILSFAKEGPGPAGLGRCRREDAVGAGEIAGAHHI